MEIECQGCYYTLCSFVCLTEDLSEILQFLWRHGCLRRSYYCEKCGRKCAIGDKDLFFRCNRNALETPINQSVSGQPVNQHLVSSVQTPFQLQTNGNTQILPHQIEPINHQQFVIAHQHASDISQGNTPVNSETVGLISHSAELSHGDKTVQTDSVNIQAVPGTIVNCSEGHQNDRCSTVIDAQGNSLNPHNNQSSLPLGQEVQSNPLYRLLQVQPNTKYSTDSKLNESQNDEPAAKILKKSTKSEGTKVGKKRCNFKVSMKKGTFFEKSKLPIDTVCKFVVFWCCMKHPTQEFLRNELSLATRTVVDWSTACREICIHWAKSVSEKIGGDGVMVQVDEVKIQDSKESKQNNCGNRFSFWGMEKDKEKGKIFIVPVPACDPWSLLTVINDWILPGSVIISNCWKAYDCLKFPDFIQQTVVQSKTFVHPLNNTGLQNFEGKSEAGVSAGGESQMPRFGTRRSHHLGDLAEFMFKRRYSNHLERMHAFFKQISLAYPLH